jgi:DNA-3-methyladenine glycosylase I
MKRCDWATEDPLYIKYHDEEWGKPVYDDRKLFEMLILEGAQAGLSWITILKRREGYRQVFHNFDLDYCENFSDADLESLREDSRIIRNKLKIYSVRSNALAFRAIVKEFASFSDYLWGFVDHQPIINYFTELEEVPATTPLSDKISKDLKKRGFKFIGSTIVYAYMQAVGLVNDHLIGCCAREVKDEIL